MSPAGRIGALLADTELVAGPGDLIFKPARPMAHVLERRALPVIFLEDARSAADV
jgi:hypothetical protein